MTGVETLDELCNLCKYGKKEDICRKNCEDCTLCIEGKRCYCDFVEQRVEKTGKVECLGFKPL